MRFANIITPSMLLACSLVHGEGHDPPERVARVSYLDGAVVLHQPGSPTFDRLLLNWPVTSGDRISTGRAARAELSFGTATIRLTENTELTVLALDRNLAQLRVSSGSVHVNVRDLSIGETFQLQALQFVIRPTQPGNFRIDVPEESPVSVFVESGEANVDVGVATFQQLAGEEAHIGVDRTVAIQPLRRPDGFDQWALSRQRSSAGEQARRHVARGMVGFEDLDSYGTWRWQQDYGMLWEPNRVSGEWAPYRFGQWIWKMPWGWTWVDDAPWGFAPFHYGRWAYVNTHWCWLPGPRQIPPVYAPALVGWTPIDHDMIGWFPLAPHEAYVPTYPASESHARGLNIFATPDAYALSGRNTSREYAHPPRDLTWAGSAVFAKAPPAAAAR